MDDMKQNVLLCHTFKGVVFSLETDLYFSVMFKGAGFQAHCRLFYRSRAGAKPNTAGVLLY